MSTSETICCDQCDEQVRVALEFCAYAVVGRTNKTHLRFNYDVAIVYDGTPFLDSVHDHLEWFDFEPTMVLDGYYHICGPCLMGILEQLDQHRHDDSKWDRLFDQLQTEVEDGAQL